MTTYHTRNPLGSTEPKDLFDNAENLDHRENDLENEEWEDRFGRSRLTWHGIEKRHERQQEKFNDDFQQFLLNSGYEDLGDYDEGIAITARNQVFRYDGELYRASAALELPYTTTGVWSEESALFVAIGDGVLRQELAKPDGASKVGYQHPSGGPYVVTQSVMGKFGRDLCTPYDFVGTKYNQPTEDSADGLERFFAEISANNVGTAYCFGNFGISRKIVVGPNSGAIATKHIVGDTVLNALNAIDTMVQFQNCQDFMWDGRVSALGLGGTSYASRTCRVGIRLGGEATANRMRFGGLIARRFSQVGVSSNNLTTLNDLGDVRVSDCGSGMVNTGFSLTANWGNRVDTGEFGSTGQRSTISVDVLPPDPLETQLFVIINGKTYFVYEVNRNASTLSVFPYIELGVNSGNLRYLFGGGAYILGSDSGILSLGVDAVRCSMGLYTAALYGPILKRLVTQSCGVGFAFGQTPSSACVGFQLNAYYAEANEFDLLRVTRASIGGTIVSEYALNLAKVDDTCSLRASNGDIPQLGEMSSVAIIHDGQVNQYQKRSGNVLASTYSMDVTDNQPIQIFRANSWTINIVDPSIPHNKLFGYDSKQVTFVGTGANSAPTGTFTFNAPAGYTVNGGASAAFSGFSGAAIFTVILDFANNNFLVSCATHAPSASTTYNPPSLADGEGVTTTVTVAGAALGDFARASFSQPLQGVTLTAWVSAADTVSVRFQNNSGSTVDLASGTLRVRVEKG